VFLHATVQLYRLHDPIEPALFYFSKQQHVSTYIRRLQAGEIYVFGVNTELNKFIANQVV
jgi:hypothetical protein